MIEFKDSQTVGNKYVQLYMGFLDSLYITNREATLEEQKSEIDVVTNHHTYEVKRQTFPDAIVIEETSMSGYDGWIHISLADYLIEVDSNEKYFLKISMKELRKWYNIFRLNYKLNRSPVSHGIYGDKWASTFRVIPISDLEKEVEIRKYTI